MGDYFSVTVSGLKYALVVNDCEKIYMQKKCSALTFWLITKTKQQIKERQKNKLITQSQGCTMYLIRFNHKCNQNEENFTDEINDKHSIRHKCASHVARDSHTVQVIIIIGVASTGIKYAFFYVSFSQIRHNKLSFSGQTKIKIFAL